VPLENIGQRLETASAIYASKGGSSLAQQFLIPEKLVPMFHPHRGDPSQGGAQAEQIVEEGDGDYF